MAYIRRDHVGSQGEAGADLIETNTFFLPLQMVEEEERYQHQAHHIPRWPHYHPELKVEYQSDRP